MSEHTEQCALFEWAEAMQNKYPELQLMFAVPNGEYRHKSTAARLKKAGVKAGVPDIILPVARGAYISLAIELKYGKNKPSEAQAWWIKRLREQGYAVGIFYSWEAARDAIIDYLGGKI